MSDVVIDANVAVKALVPTEQSISLDAQMVIWARQGTTLLVPPHFFSEVLNTLRRKVVQREITLADGDRLLEDFRAFPAQLVSVPRPFELAWILAKEYQLSGTYDAEYLAVAQLFGCEFWTADKRFLRQLGSQRPDWVKSVASDGT